MGTKRVLLSMALFFLAMNVFAQDTKNLSLNEAIELSIKNSKQLKVSTAKIQEATASLTEAIQRRLPDASVTGSYMKLSNANVSLKTQQQSGGSGGNGGGGGTPKISQAMYGIANVGLPLYTGGKIRYGIESSRFLAEAAKLDADNDKENVIENTVEAYVNLYKARKAVDLVTANLTGAKQRVKDFSNLEQNGLLARNDLLKAELQESNTELSLLDAENNWELANLNMNLMLGLPDKTVLTLDSTIVNQNFKAEALDDYVQSAIKNRKDVQSLDLRKQAAESGVKVTRGDYYPNVQLSGGYIAADIPKFLTITNAVNIGVGFSYNIASLWKTKAKVEGAEARVREVQANEELLNDNIRLQVNKAYLNFLSSQKKIDVNATAVQQADENYRIINNKYQNGLATTTDLLDADVARLQAHMNYEFSKADVVVTYNQLLHAAGQLSQSTK